MQKVIGSIFLLLLCFAFTDALATGAQLVTKMDAGGVANEIKSSFDALARFVTAGAYLAGLAFSLGAIMKFKQHKDNPTQVPIGTPLGLLAIAACLLFLPSVLGVTGQTLFGKKAKTATAEGWVWNPKQKEVTNTNVD